MKKYLILGIFTVIFFTVNPVYAVSTDIGVINDTWIYSVTPDTNYCTWGQNILQVADSQLRSFLFFDFSSIPHGSVINSATLYLYGYSGSSSYPVNIERNSGYINACAITWNNQPTVNGLLANQWLNASSQFENIIPFNLTQFNQLLIANYGIRLYAVSDAGIFNNRLGGNGGSPPFIRVDYTVVVNPYVMDNNVKDGTLKVVTGLKNTIFDNILKVLPTAGLVLVSIFGIKILMSFFTNITRGGGGGGDTDAGRSVEDIADRAYHGKKPTDKEFKKVVHLK